MSGRGTSNSLDPSRGNQQQRRARKLWLLATFGDGISAPCVFCGVALLYSALTVDRIVPGCQGGTYRAENIRPACGPCNSREGCRVRTWRPLRVPA